VTPSFVQAVAVVDRERVASFASEDLRERVAHFVEQRPPAFDGR